jgi:hypothetical protein
MVDNLIRGPQLSIVIVTGNHAAGLLNLLYFSGNRLTLPSEASSNWTGDSRTDATKQNDDTSRGVARGYQMKSRMGAARGNMPVLGGSNGARARDKGNKTCNRSQNKQCAADPTEVTSHSISPADLIGV